MAGQFRFKNNSGTVVAQISASNAGAMSFSGSALDFSSVTTLTLGTTTLSGTASFATTAVSSSYGLNALTGSNAMTASSADTLYVRNNATVLGSITAQTLIVQTVTSSVLFTTGSNKIGSSLSNVQELTGSVGITGSLAINGTTAVVGSGTANYVPKFTASGTIGNSAIYDDGTSIGIGATTNLNFGVATTVGISVGGSSAYAGIQLRNTTGNLELFVGGDSATDTFIRNNMNGNLRFGTNGNEKMRITAAGNVIIGSAVAATNVKLLLNGVVNKGASIEFQQSGVSQWYLGNGAASEDNNFELYNSNGTMAMKIIKSTNAITFNGNVLINTTTSNSTGTKLQVSGNVFFGNSSIGMFGTTGNTSYYSLVGINEALSTYTKFELRASSTDGQICLHTNGNNSMGTLTDGGYRLYVSGAIYATGNITANSDLRLKKNLQIIDNPIDKLMELNGYSYQWKADDEYQYGVIAQEVEKILPYAVSTCTDGIKGVSYNQIIPVLIEAIKELSAKVTLLENK